MGKLVMGTITDLDRSTFQVKWLQEGNQGATWKEATVNVKSQQSFYVRIYIKYNYGPFQTSKNYIITFYTITVYTHTRINVIYLFYTTKIQMVYWRSCRIFGAQKSTDVIWRGFDVICACPLFDHSQQPMKMHTAVPLHSYGCNVIFLVIANVSSLIALFTQDKFSFLRTFPFCFMLNV